MPNTKLYTPIFERKSIRKFADTPLTPEQLELVKAEIAAVTPLLPDEKFALELNSAKEGWRIYGYCENTALSNANLGHILQQLDLALHLHGLGRLWYGFGRAPRDVKAPKGMSYAMCLKIGVAAEPLARKLSDFDRKASIADDEALAELLEPARLAPSAMNSQPWMFTAEGDAIHVWCKQPGLKKLILGRMNQLDMGIALCHAVLALEHAGRAFAVEAKAPAQGLDGYYYLVTLELHS